MKNMWTKLSGRTAAIVATVSAGATALALTVQNQVYANAGISSISNAFTDAFKAIYSEIITVSTILACVFIAICLLMRMVSKNPRAVEEATSWIKRIVITWLCLMLLSLFVNYGLDIVKESGANTSDPWNG